MQAIGHGTVCSDSILNLPYHISDEPLTLNHPLAFSNIRNLSSTDLWYLHEQLKILVQDRYTMSFAIWDGLSDAELVAKYDSWVLVDMLLHQLELGRKPEPPFSPSISGTSSPRSSESWQEVKVIVRDFGDGTPSAVISSTLIADRVVSGLCLEDVYDLANCSERKAAHLLSLKNRGEARKAEMPSGASKTCGKPQALDADGNCLFGCNGRCRHIVDCTPAQRPADSSGAPYLMSDALPEALASVLEDHVGAFCIRGKQPTQNANAHRNKSIKATAEAEASWNQASKLETGTIEDQRGRTRLRDLGRRLSAVSLACRTFLNPAGVRVAELLPTAEAESGRSGQVSGEQQAKVPRRTSSMFWRSKSRTRLVEVEDGKEKDELRGGTGSDDWAFLRQT